MPYFALISLALFGRVPASTSQESLRAQDAAGEELTGVGLQGTRLTGQDLLDFEPALKEGLAGAWVYTQDGQVRPDQMLRAWREKLQEMPSLSSKSGLHCCKLTF